MADFKVLSGVTSFPNTPESDRMATVMNDVTIQLKDGTTRTVRHRAECPFTAMDEVSRLPLEAVLKLPVLRRRHLFKQSRIQVFTFLVRRTAVRQSMASRLGYAMPAKLCPNRSGSCIAFISNTDGHAEFVARSRAEAIGMCLARYSDESWNDISEIYNELVAEPPKELPAV